MPVKLLLGILGDLPTYAIGIQKHVCFCFVFILDSYKCLLFPPPSIQNALTRKLQKGTLQLVYGLHKNVIAMSQIIPSLIHSVKF